MKLFIWGTGNCAGIVQKSLKPQCEVLGYIDSDEKKHNTLFQQKYRIISPEEINKWDYDLIIISVLAYESVLKDCDYYKVPQNKIMVFWKLEQGNEIVDIREKKIYELQRKCKRYEVELENMPYELGLGVFPQIESAEHLLEEVLQNHKSFTRYGDGEFEIMCGRERAWFQKDNEKLAQRLKEILYADQQFCLVAIADNFGNLEKYTDRAANDIRLYLQGKRNELVEMLGTQRKYYDAYVSRPYIMYKDKKNAERIIGLFKRIFCDRNILIVEGEHTRNGVGNDLFSDARSVQRIIGPAKNAFDKYQDILEKVLLHADKSDLITITMGPTATVLAYDLAARGYQALDIGQIDNEYEWYLRRATERIKINGKTVAEVPAGRVPDRITDKKYESEIVDRI